MTAISKIGILGLGSMGAPMARHLVSKGYSVTGYDPLEMARRNARALGVSVLDSPREVARASELVIVVVGFEHEVETVVFGPNGINEAANQGLTVALGSTVAPRYARRLAERLRERGLVLLDIPLARGGAAGAPGKLLLRGGVRSLPAGLRRVRLGHLPSRRGRRRAGRQDGEQPHPVDVHRGERRRPGPRPTAPAPAAGPRRQRGPPRPAARARR